MIHKNIDEIKEDIIEVITTRYPLIRKEDIKPDSLLSVMIEAITLEVSSLYDEIDIVDKQNRVSTANKSYLDLIGNSVGIYRKGGQEDESYRYDIVNWFTNSRTSSRNAIEQVIRDCTGVYTYSIENLAYGAGTFAVHIQTKDSSNTSLVAQELYESLREVVAQGVLFKVITPKDINVEMEIMVVGETTPAIIANLKSAIRTYVTSIKPGDSLYVSRIEVAALNSSTAISAVFLVNTRLNGKLLYSKEAKLLTDEQFRISDNNITIK